MKDAKIAKVGAISESRLIYFKDAKIATEWIFRIVERIKHIKIQPRATAIPFGLSGAAGRIVVLLILVVLCGSLFPLGRLTHISRNH